MGEESPRRDRLRVEKNRLDVVNRESDYVNVRAVVPTDGAPERYLVTFTCRGIIDINPDKYPIYRETHEVEIYCDANFPADVPQLRWITPIWHPNVNHREPKNVCVNKWVASLGLDHLCWQMFDMVQYRNYHAAHSPPFPLDDEVARWVREFAEPRNIVNKSKGKFVDDKPFFRPGSDADVSGSVASVRPPVVVSAQPPLTVQTKPPVEPRRRVVFLSSTQTTPTVRAAASGSRKVRFL